MKRANKIVCSRRQTLSFNIDRQIRLVYSTSYRQIDVKPASRTVRDARLDEFFAALKRANP